MTEFCFCPECGLPAEVVTDTPATADDGDAGHGLPAVPARDQLVGVRCIRRHWFFGLRERLVA